MDYPRRAMTAAAVLAAAAAAAASDWQPAERLDRGLVAVRDGDGRVTAGWRLLASDPPGVAFNLYRVAGGEEERVNGRPLTGATWLVDDRGGAEYCVRAVVGGEEQAPSRRARVLEHPWLEVPLRTPDGYRPGDCAAGDLDGDGAYELVVHQVCQPRDNGSPGLTGAPVLDAHELDGTFLWRIELGRNIREGEHYTQFMVYDLDGDGRAEVACKTADGTRDGAGRVIGDGGRDWRNHEQGTPRHGRVLAGPEFLTIFDGRTGAALATADYIPGRDPIDGWGGIGGNGRNDDHGNRCDRFLACVAYLDGRRPSLVMCRGVYGRSVLAAWDWRDGRLTSRWVFDTGVSRPPFAGASPFSGMGGHSLAVADVDADGRDEIVYQAMAVDDDGTGLYATGRRHGDSLCVGDFDPQRPGLELYLVTENEDATVRFGTPGAGMHDARTGGLLWSHSPGVDISDGMVADIDPRHPGAEVWGGPGGLRTATGRRIGPGPRFADWVVWWDGDLLREIYAGHAVFKWDWEGGRERRIFAAEPPFARDGRRGWRFPGARPNLAADLLGDWREELVLTGPGARSLRVHLTTEPTAHRVACLMGERQYRLAVALQNVAYNKPPQPARAPGAGGGAGAPREAAPATGD